MPSSNRRDTPSNAQQRAHQQHHQQRATTPLGGRQLKGKGKATTKGTNMYDDDDIPEWMIQRDEQEEERKRLELELGTRAGLAMDYTFGSTTDTHSRGGETDRDAGRYAFGDDAAEGHEEYDPRDATYDAHRSFDEDEFEAEQSVESVEYGRHRPSHHGDVSIASSLLGGAGGRRRTSRHGAFETFEDLTEDLDYTDHSHTQHSHTATERLSPHQRRSSQQQSPLTSRNAASRVGGHTEDESLLARGGDTLSTAQHHASGITLGAGLRGWGGPGGGGFNSRTPSRSNISLKEFDPERRLAELIADMVESGREEDEEDMEPEGDTFLMDRKTRKVGKENKAKVCFYDVSLAPSELS